MLGESFIKRLSLYRRLLGGLEQQRLEHVYSHDLAAAACASAAQVRRDLMTIGFAGNPRRGYEVRGLITRIGEFLDAPQGQNVIVVGLGQVGKAVIGYFSGQTHALKIVAGFDVVEERYDRVIHGVRCYSMEQLSAIVEQTGATIAIIAVPSSASRKVVLQLLRVGIRGLLNFTPVRLQVPDHIYVENVDIYVSLENVAFFARHGTVKPENVVREMVS